MAKLDWLTLNHFIAMAGSGASSIVLSSADNSFFKLGHNDIVEGVTHLDTETPLISVLAGGQVDGPSLGIPSQGGEIADAVTGSATGKEAYPETTYSLLQSSDPSVMLWPIKPAEEGISSGTVARFWNLSTITTSFTATLQGGMQSASAVTHLETNPVKVMTTANGLPLEMKPLQLRSFLLQPVVPGTPDKAKQSVGKR